MLQELINHNPQLQKLKDEGFNLRLDNGFLVADNIPYLDESGNIKYGIFIDALVMNGLQILKPRDHTLYFNGLKPHDNSQKPISSIIHPSSRTKKHTSSLESNFYFSSKPDCGRYKDYYEKFTTYFKIVSGGIISMYPNIISVGSVKLESDNSHFKYLDTNTTRADIQVITDKLKNYKVAIVGCGGTGSYILDFLSKTPLGEVHIFDNDEFLQHNAFRAPGAFEIEVMEQRLSKVEVFKENYSKIKNNIYSHCTKVDEKNLPLFNEFDFVFLALDSGKEEIIAYLEKNRIPFVDTGIGLFVNEDSLGGNVKAVFYDGERGSHLKNYINYTNKEDELYETNIQIAELNSMAAAMAVYKWKASLGFYSELKQSNVLTFSISTGNLYAEDKN